MTDRFVTLVTKEKEEVKVPIKITQMSGLISSMLEDHSDDHDEPIPLPSIRKDTLLKIMDYCEKCNYVSDNFVKKPVRTKDIDELFPLAWERQFFQAIELAGLSEILEACNFLDLAKL